MLFLLADDQPKVRFALRVLLERQTGFRVLGEAANAAEMLALATAICPDVVLLDWELPGLDHVATIAQLRAFCPHSWLIALSGLPEVEMEALDAGVDAFVSKGVPPDHLLVLLRKRQDDLTAGLAGAGAPANSPGQTSHLSPSCQPRPATGALFS